MTQQEYKSLGLAVKFEVPASVDEFDSNAKKVGACLSEAINNIVYRTSLAQFRDEFLHGRKGDAEKGITAVEGVEAMTGIARKTDPVMKDGKPVVEDGEPVTTYAESEAKYFNRVLVQLVADGKYPSEEEALASFQRMADETAAGIKFDASASERKATGPKKLAQKFKVVAARILANGTINKANEAYFSRIGKSFTATDDRSKLFKAAFEVVDPSTKKVSTQTVEVSDKDAESLGWLLKEYQDWKTQNELNSMAE